MTSFNDCHGHVQNMCLSDIDKYGKAKVAMRASVIQAWEIHVVE